MTARKLRILVVDDESIIRMDLREMLTELGHEVVAEAATGQEAVLQARKFDPDLVFLDIKMPGMNGLEALSHMNGEKLRPTIVLTAFSEARIVDKAVELGAKAYIVKPFQATSLLPAIRLAMAHFQELRALSEENTSLKETIDVSKLVSRAKGLLMEHEGLSEQEAFRKIQTTSMEENRKARDVAEAIILVYGKRPLRRRPGSR